MDVFVYQSALLCSACGEKQRKHLDEAFAENGATPVDVEDESSYDSDRYPKGPYSDGGGEADSPQHCDHCTVFLENPLTGDGQEYVISAWRDRIESGFGNPAVLLDWLDHYDWLWRDFKEDYEARFEALEEGR